MTETENFTVVKPSTAEGMGALPYTVIRVCAGERSNPSAVHTGTGFFYTLDLEGGGVPMIVTNKHVIDDRAWLSFDFALVDERGDRVLGKPKTIDAAVEKLKIVRHPDPSVDLAAIAINPVLEFLSKEGFQPYYLNLSKANFAPDYIQRELHASASALMIGFPNGLMDTENNLPVVRKGVLATHYYSDYLGQQNFVIDIASFGGSSGSPVFAFFEGVRPTEDGGVGIFTGAAVYLIGVLHSGPVINAQGRIVPAPVPTSYPRAEISLSIHLGYALKAHLVEDLADEVKEFL